MISASCTVCGRGYRVPRADRTYPCKACGGEVRVPADDDEGASDSGAECPECGLAVEREQAFCESCGAALGGGDGAGRPARRSRGAHARAELVLARGELEGAKRAVGFVRALCLIGVAVTAVPLVATVLLLRGFGALQLLLLAVYGIECALYAFAAWRVRREPLLWSGIVAAFRTLSFLLLVLSADWDAPGVPLVVVLSLSASWTALLWVAVLRVARVRSVIAEHPEAWDAVGELRRRGVGRHHDPAQLGHRGRRVAADRRRSRRSLLIGGAGALIVLGLGWGGYALATRPPSFGPVLAEFTRSWNASDVDAVVGHFRAERREAVRRWLTRSSGERDGSGGLPAVADSEVESPASDRRVVRLRTQGGGSVRVAFSAESGVWIATSAQVEP